MTEEKFAALVAKLETQARNNPIRYRAKVFLLALIGNLYLGAMIALIALTFIGLLIMLVASKGAAFKPAIIVGALLWTVVKALWVTIEAPQGIEITREQAPELFTLIDELCSQLRAPRFHHVLVNDEFNAGVVQSPRLGIFGWDRNYLLLGLPLLKAMSVEQFKAVLAHEFGHLAKGHGRFSNWIYRQRLRWSRLVNELEENKGRGVFLFKPFLNWFSPYFSAFSFPLARANEYEADATSARLTSSRAAAEALTSVNVLSSYLSERFWPQIHKLADEQPRPNFAPYQELSHRVATEIDTDSLRRWLRQAMARATTPADTHPALADRLSAIGETPRLAPPKTGESADRLLGSALEAITERFDHNWQEHIFEVWQRRYREVQDGRAALAGLDEKFASGAELTPQEVYDRAKLTENYSGDADAALQQFRDLLERMPHSGFVSLMLGARLLDRDDDSGLALVDRAVELDDDLTLQRFEILRDYHWRLQNEEQAHQWHRQLIERSLKEQMAEKERSNVFLTDSFESHDFDVSIIETLRAQLQAVEGLDKAFFIKKHIQHFPERPHYVLGFIKKRGLLQRNKFTDDEVMYRLKNNVEFPAATSIINIGQLRRFRGKFKKVKAAQLV
jgi:Zn-dependent protease with chaperone function